MPNGGYDVNSMAGGIGPEDWTDWNVHNTSWYVLN
jgi:hypothetical protein